MVEIAFSTIVISAKENVPSRYHSPQQVFQIKLPPLTFAT